jgi:hypothetical protein
MKLSCVVISLLIAGQSCSAFVNKASFSARNNAMVQLNMVELIPEPDGGEEVTALKPIEGSRMKNMGVAVGVKSDDGTAHKFWLTAKAQGTLIKELHRQVLKDASKEAMFPGFRKVRRGANHCDGSFLVLC